MLKNTWAKAGIDPQRLFPSGPLMRRVKEVSHLFSYQSRKQQLVGHLDHLLPRE
jgi:hypothetical protein